MMRDELDALVLADAIGALDAPERRLLQERLAALTPAERDGVAAMYEATLHVAASIEPSDPPAHVRASVIESARQPARYTLRAGDAWDMSGVPGIAAKVLAVDAARGLVTLLMRGDPGATYPAHRHSAPEECYVIRGCIAIGSLVLHAGDFHHADADSEHEAIAVLEPSDVLLIGAIADYLPR